VKHQGGRYHYVAKLSHKDKPYYDLDVELMNSDDSKKLKTHLKSFVVDNFDYGLEAKVNNMDAQNYNVEGTLLRAGKNCAQLTAACKTPAGDNSQVRKVMFIDFRSSTCCACCGTWIRSRRKRPSTCARSVTLTASSISPPVGRFTIGISIGSDRQGRRGRAQARRQPAEG